ncbi:hypothetical protein EJ02DRAFT_457976 [Clathrospora elynae]|uniref:Uncharacterized protein n=1 Tax=Clathrospora elynae TaxID=706981 RepID=A0A6A5SLV8_9PLEO|nr:hypothetical protein EJ02DRAFT_457976 [Clathrospora elynae]
MGPVETQALTKFLNALAAKSALRPKSVKTAFRDLLPHICRYYDLPRWEEAFAGLWNAGAVRNGKVDWNNLSTFIANCLRFEVGGDTYWLLKLMVEEFGEVMGSMSTKQYFPSCETSEQPGPSSAFAKET